MAVVDLGNLKPSKSFSFLLSFHTPASGMHARGLFLASFGS
jgi:hypothetical protein